MKEKTEIKYEHYERPDFPVYSSVQEGRKELVIVHYHPAMEFIKVISGSVRFLISDNYITCNCGDILFIPSSVVHGAGALTTDSAIRGVTFESTILDRIGVIGDIQKVFKASAKNCFIISPDASIYGELDEALSRIGSNYGDFSTAGKMLILSQLIMAGSLLIKHFELSKQAENPEIIRLMPVIDHIHHHYAEKIRIDELSSIIHVCDDRLIRLFNDATGKTPMEYVMSLRIENAIKLLSSTDESVARIAERSGFGSDTYMTRVFRKRLNMTPGAYRKQKSRNSVKSGVDIQL